MKKFCWTLLSFGWIAAAAAPPSRLADSLKTAYEREADTRRRVDLLLDLKDLSDGTEEEMVYSRLLFREASAAGDGFATGASLGSLAAYYIATPGKEDSLEIVLRKAEPLLRGTSMEGLATYYRMTARARIIQTASTEKSVELC